MDFLKPYPSSALIIGLCALLCLLSLNLLNQDLNSQYGDSQTLETGTVLKTTELVKRKSKKSLLWNSLKDQSHLFNQDSIRVGPKSSAVFELDNGEKVELGEDSFFVVESGRKIDEQLKRGVMILNQNGEKTLLETQKDGSLKKRKLEASLISPENNFEFILTTEEKGTIPFEWTTTQTSSDKSSPSIQLSTNQKFSSGLLPQQTGSYLLPPGTYYWRVIAEGEPISEVRSFSIQKLSPIKLLSPSRTENITRIDLNLPILFSWKAEKKIKNDLREDLLKIAEDSDFKKTVTENKISALTGFSEIKLLHPGTYYWKIVSQIGPDKSVQSETRTFHLTQVDNIKISLLSPLDETVLRKPEELLFQWEANGGDAEYQLDVTDFATKNNVFSQITKGTSVSWKNPAAGNFLWRVTVKNALRSVASSDRRILTLIQSAPIGLVSPKAFESHLFWEKPPSLLFAWEMASQATEYRLEFSDTDSFKKTLYSQTVKKNEVTSDKLEIPLGKLYWRVRAIDSEQLTINMSESRSFTFEHPPVLRAPTNFDPPRGTVWDVVKEGKELSIKWDPVPEANKYEVTIVGSTSNTFNTRVDSPELLLKHYKAGKYKISVSAVDRLGRVGPALGPIELIVRYSALKAPESEAPEVK